MQQAQPSGAGQQPATRGQRRRVPMALVTWAFVALVLFIVVVLLVVKVTRGSTTLPPPQVTPASASVVTATTSLPASVFDAAGAPEASAPSPLVLSGQPPLTIDGRPAVVYVGGEFCPYCAAVRWSLVAALARFGTFSNLGATTSSNFEVFPGTPTFSFNGTGYRSRYVTFSATEQYGQSPSNTPPAGFPPAGRVPPLDQELMKRYGSAGSSNEPATLPFIDVGNRLVATGAAVGFSPALLAGSSMNQIAGQLSNPTSNVSRAVLGEANMLSAAICAATGGQPATVCQSPGVQAAASRLGV